MKNWKYLMIVLTAFVLVLCLSACATETTKSSAEISEGTRTESENLETGSTEEQLAAARLRIAELETLVNKYRPVYESQIVAVFGDDGVILKDAAAEQYNSTVKMYQQYGISVDGYSDAIKKKVLESLVLEEILGKKAQELGLKEFDNDESAELFAQAENTFKDYVQQYKANFAVDSSGNAVSDEDAAASAAAFLNQNGLTIESLLTILKNNLISERLYAHITGDVRVSDEDVKEKYEELTQSDQKKYENDHNYCSARARGELITWNPEGYRAVKHVLIKFSDEQSARRKALMETMKSLNAELEALKKNAETADAAEEPQKNRDSDTNTVSAQARTQEQIQNEIEQAQSELDALYVELLPKAQDVISEFNGGTDFDTLIEKYGEDPGMKKEPAKKSGYAVSANSTYWEKAFTEGAMAIPGIGQLSEPVKGTNGLHIICYIDDITPGAVPLKSIAADIEALALTEKKAAAYTAQVDAWLEEATPVYYPDRF